jgi:pyruvate dehydrogenase E2 component (dihydrolipoamide acetyltransferase)
LVVPVNREADKKTIYEIAGMMARQTEAYLENHLSTGDFLGGTFTVTDLSRQGVSFFQPLLAEGQSAILSIGKGPGQQGETILYLTLAFAPIFGR